MVNEGSVRGGDLNESGSQYKNRKTYGVGYMKCTCFHRKSNCLQKVDMLFSFGIEFLSSVFFAPHPHNLTGLYMPGTKKCLVFASAAQWWRVGIQFWNSAIAASVLQCSSFVTHSTSFPLCYTCCRESLGWSDPSAGLWHHIKWVWIPVK